MISVVMASYLGEYKLAAKNRETKIRRAVESVLSQTIPVELVVIADGCQKTVDILTKNYEGKFSGYMINKQLIWSGIPRNTGIEKAKGDIICYLDIDDFLAKDHCENIITQFGNSDWVWFDDWVWTSVSGWKQRKCNVEKKGFCGTSNIAHKKITPWSEKGNYTHDWVMLQKLKSWSANYKYIGHGGYHVAHIPGRYDV
jgi:glycosyltransferase involved in cell wall biosynthesis